jgi:hypothetical protein
MALYIIETRHKFYIVICIYRVRNTNCRHNPDNFVDFCCVRISLHPYNPRTAAAVFHVRRLMRHHRLHSCFSHIHVRTIQIHRTLYIVPVVSYVRKFQHQHIEPFVDYEYKSGSDPP